MQKCGFLGLTENSVTGSERDGWLAPCVCLHMRGVAELC
jgi:hypothetical protein